MKQVLFFLMSLGLSAGLVSQAQAEPAAGGKIAVIQMTKAIKSVKEGKKAEDELKREWEDRKKKLEAEAKKLQTAMDDFRKQAMVMDEKSRMEKQEAIQNQMKNFQELEQKNQQEFQAKDAQISEPIIKKMRTVVAQVSKDKGYTLVVDDANVIYVQDQDDITDEVIKRYDSKK